VRVLVWFQFFRFVGMTVRAVFPLMFVLVFWSIARMGMLVLMLVLMFVFVDVVVLVSVRSLVVGVFMCMSMSVLVLMLMLVTVIVLTFHWISSLFKTSNNNRLTAGIANRATPRARERDSTHDIAGPARSAR
jgi:hypothetical protein